MFFSPSDSRNKIFDNYLYIQLGQRQDIHFAVHIKLNVQKTEVI